MYNDRDNVVQVELLINLILFWTKCDISMSSLIKIDFLEVIVSGAIKVVNYTCHTLIKRTKKLEIKYN